MAGPDPEKVEELLRAIVGDAELPDLDQLAQELQAAEPPPAYEIVLIVHGTFANPDYGRPGTSSSVPWWRSHGSFGRALDRALERYGSDARCSLPVEVQLAQMQRPAFSRLSYWSGWSGANSETERRKGAHELARRLRALQGDDGISRVHIVAHSHGGNVALRALRYLNEPMRKLGAVICLGTPFLHFADRAVWRRWLTRIHWPMLLATGGLAALGWWQREWLMDSENLVHAVLFSFLLAAGLYLIWRFAVESEASSEPTPAVGMRFENDEAIQLLRSGAAMSSEPHLFLRDLLGGAAERRESSYETSAEGRLGRALGRSRELAERGWFALSNLWNGPLCRTVERLTTLVYRLPLVGFAGALGSLLLILAFRPYRPPLRPFLLSRMPRLGQLFFHSMEQETERAMREYEKLPWQTPVEKSRSKGFFDDSFLNPETWRNLIAGVTALLYFVFYPIDLVLGLPAWLGAVFTRFAILIGARAAAGTAPGMDMLGAAFRPARTGTVPPEVRDVVVPEELERDIAERLDGQSRIDLASLRAGLAPEKRATLLQAVESAFTDVGLLHAQYYQDPRVIDYVAQRIAAVGTPGGEPEWELDPTAIPEPADED